MAVGVSSWAVTTGAAVGLTASTARTVIGVKADSNKSFKVMEFGISFDGTDATRAPVLVEFCSCTWATKAPGTNSDSVTPVLVSGKGVTDEISAAKAWAASNEPTTLTPLFEYQIDSNKGALIIQFPLGEEPESVVAEGFAIRCTSGASSTPNVRAYMRVGT